MESAGVDEERFNARRSRRHPLEEGMDARNKLFPFVETFARKTLIAMMTFCHQSVRRCALRQGGIR